MHDDEFFLDQYRRLFSIKPELFSNPTGCPIEILLDPAKISEAQKHVHSERKQAGHTTADLRVGLLAEDHFIGYVVRDAVRFSDGRLGLYNRIVTTEGAVVLPILDGAIALIHIFRHAPRRWFFEAPQGLIPPGADPGEEARRELDEEMGAVVAELFPLGRVYTSTALTSENLHVFAARITNTGEPQASEGIDGIRIISNNQIDELLLDGTICDGPTTTAIARARACKLL
ncbi:MAG: ADP-ribose pyrophosphatase [Alphaproteobacteria bacterium]|nr:ADP-ribose pyrophosphatase [Alphaproteobacteria bacterium]